VLRDDATRGGFKRGVERQPLASRQLLGAIEQEESGRFPQRSVGKDLLLLGAKTGRADRDDPRLETAGGELRNELLQEDRGTTAMSTDDGAAPTLVLEASQEGFPAVTRWKAKRDMLNASGCEGILDSFQRRAEVARAGSGR
jgi:hypothetical protein